MCTKATKKIGGITPIDKIFAPILVQVSSAWDFRMSTEIDVPLSLPLPNQQTKVKTATLKTLRKI